MMPAGTYYVGDLCYVMHDEWDEVCDLIIDGPRCIDGEFTLKDGRRFAIYSTAYGDGCYTDQRGNRYGVDSGSIGCILVSDIGPSDSNDVGGGNVHTFDRPFSTSGGRGESGWDGRIHIGSIVVSTGDEEDDDEYDPEE
jgi:hypothetical protein